MLVLCKSFVRYSELTKPVNGTPFGFCKGHWGTTKTNSSVSEKELFAVTWAFSTPKPYLGVHPKVHTDQACRFWLAETTEALAHLIRSRLRLSIFEFQVEHNKGVFNTHADALWTFGTSIPLQSTDDLNIQCFTTREIHGSSETFTDDTWNEILATETEKTMSGSLIPITSEEMIKELHTEPSRTKVWVRPIVAHKFPFRTDENGYLIQTVESRPILRCHTLYRISFYTYHIFGSFEQILKRRRYTPPYQGTFTGRPGLSHVMQSVGYMWYAHGKTSNWRSPPRRWRFFWRLYLWLFSTDILRDLMKTPRGFKYLLVITERFSKLIQTVPVNRTIGQYSW